MEAELSVELTIKSDKAENGLDGVPIATNAAFKEFWLPGCSALNLQWVPLFIEGLDLERESLPDILNELSRLRSWMIQNHSGKDRDFLVDRLDRLSKKLTELQRTPKIEAWIG